MKSIPPHKMCSNFVKECLPFDARRKLSILFFLCVAAAATAAAAVAILLFFGFLGVCVCVYVYSVRARVSVENYGQWNTKLK